MKSLYLSERGPEIRELPAPGRPDEARIRLSLGGICATDLELVRGYMGFTGVLGHEWVGVVEAAPDAAWVGRRVVGEINCPCGRCPACLAGRGNHCPERSVLGILGRDGAFAEQLSLPLGNLHEVPAGVPDEAAVFTEPLAAACQILEQVHVTPGQSVVVLGAGRLGQLCARVLALTGARVSVVNRSRWKLARLPRSVEAVPLEEAAELPPADVVVECTGAPQGLALATDRVRPGGTLVLKTTIKDPEGFDATRWVIDEITVVGSRCGPFDAALRLLAGGLVDPTPLISGRRALGDGVAALAEAGAGDRLKVLLDPGA
jgi:alcohol dehydrogenase